MTLSEESVHADPLVQARHWLDEALLAGIHNAEAVALATSAADGLPSVRFVLCKQLDAQGFVFFTNLESRKARELASRPHGALAFYWDAFGRQLRATGPVEEVPRKVAAAYFETRPRGSRIGAWASPQSRPIASRGELEALWEDTAERFRGSEPPLPPHWGGYRLLPEEIELWEHRDSRLHDRLLYRRDGNGWRRTRLAP